MSPWPIVAFLFFAASSIPLVESFIGRGSYFSLRSSRACQLHQTRVPSSFTSLYASVSTEEKGSDIDVLKKACESKKVLPEDVASSINSLEAQQINVKCSDIRGQWELIYSSIIPGGYFPVKEIADFYVYSLTSSYGPLSLGGFLGSAKILSETNPAVIEFSSERYRLGPLKFEIKEPKSRSYTFLYVDNYFAVARSSSGGGTLLRRVVD